MVAAAGIVVLAISGAVAFAVFRPRPVDIAVPSPGPVAARACAALDAALPATVDGQAARSTDPDSQLTAAWGEPAIVLRCGVPKPGQLQPAAELATVNGIDWLPVQESGGYVFTTSGRQAYVEVRVPSAYAPEVNALTDLAGPISEAVPEAR